MSFYIWVAQVEQIAVSRNLLLTTSYSTGPTGQNWVSFNWRAADNSRYGSAGAGEELIGLTTPEQFTWDWYGGATAPVPEPLISPDPWNRRGRHIPRVPAMAVSDALQALFRI